MPALESQCTQSQSSPLALPSRRPLYVDLIGAFAGMLLLFGASLWFAKLYSPNSTNLLLYKTVWTAFFLTALFWLLLFVYWSVRISTQRRAILQANRLKATATYQLDQVRQKSASKE